MGKRLTRKEKLAIDLIKEGGLTKDDIDGLTKDDLVVVGDDDTIILVNDRTGIDTTTNVILDYKTVKKHISM